MAAADGTTRRKIRLDFTSGTPSLAGLNATTAAVNRLGVALRNVSKWGAVFQTSTGFELKGLGASAATAATTVTKALGTINTAAQKTAQGLQQSFKEATTTFTKTGDMVRSTESVFKSGFKTTKNVERFARKKDDEVWSMTSSSEVLKTDFRAQNKAAELAQARAAHNAQVMANVQNREREAGIAAEAKMRAELAQRAQVEVNRRFAEAQRAFEAQMSGMVAQRNLAVAGLPGKTLARNQGIAAAEQQLIIQLNALASRAGVGSRLQGELNRTIQAAQVRMARAYARIASVTPPIMRRPSNPLAALWGGDTGWLDRGLRGWTPMGFAKNMLTAGGWMAAVTAPMKAIQLGGYSIERGMQLQLQTARLTQVFQKAGGTAKELSDDVLALAAAEGRTTEEAIQAAIQWSRLGLSRKQAAEATRVSLMAANVAEMTAAESTQYLSAVMASYNLQVSDLNSVLGMLNQSSNTYRVTNKDLLEGLSRVSSVAQQAGISLAQLQGMLAASVQKTGQTGANMANAMKTILVRLNRPDVKEFFGERFNMDVAGTAQSLQEVWEAYQRANDEQRQDILLKVGGATQANRFRAILESYTEGIVAAAESLRNLNSAERENLLITNTAAAARQRMVSSFERLINGDVGVGALSKMFNVGAGIMAGLSNAKGLVYPTMAAVGNRVFGQGTFSPVYQQQLSYWNAKNADPRVALRLIAAPWSYSLPGTMQGLGFSSTPTTMEDKWKVDAMRINAARSAGEADEMLAKQYQRIAGNWGSFGENEREMVVKSLERVLPKESLARLRGGDASTLTEEATRLMEDSKRNHQEAQEETDKALASRKEELRILHEKKTLTAQQKNDEAELTRQVKDLTRERTRLLYEDLEPLEDEETKLEKITQQMAMHKGLMEGIANLSGRFAASPRVAEIMSLEAQNAATRGLPIQGIMEEERARRQKFLRENEARIDILRSNQMIAYERAQRRAATTGTMAEMEVGAKGVGLTEGERLLDRRLWLQRELDRIMSNTARTEEDNIRGVVYANALYETQLRIQDRILNIDRERQQILIESNREFQRSLIGSSPSQLLSKLATFQLNKQNGGKWSAGEFFSMTGESQRDIYELMGGDRMSMLNREQGAVGGWGMSSTGVQRFTQDIQDATDTLAVSAQKASLSMATAAGYAANIEASFAVVAKAIAAVTGVNITAPTASRPANH